MRKLVRTGLVLASALALALTGCRPPLNLVRPHGPGFVAGTGGAEVKAEPAGYGGMNVAIKWPPPIQRAVQAIPAVANTLHLKVTTREGVVKASRIFNRPATTESLISTASMTVGVGSSLIVEVNAYRQQFATDSVGVLPTAEQIIAQGTQENVTVTLNATSSVRLALDPDVTIAGRGGAPSLGLNRISWTLIDNDPRGPAIWTELNQPENLVYDPVGKFLYFTQRPDPGRPDEGYRVMRLSLVSNGSTGSYGVPTLVAGGSLLNTSRDTANAPNTPISSLRSVATDRNGNLYYIEQGTLNRVRRMAPDNTVTTFIGSGLSNPEGLLVNGDRLYVTETTANRVSAFNLSGARIWTAGGGADNADGATTSFVPLASASIPAPSALAVTGNALYVSSGAGRVLQINLALAETPGSDCIRTLTAVDGDAPNAAAAQMDETTFGVLTGIAASGGNLYLADQTNRTIWRVGDTPTATLSLQASRINDPSLFESLGGLLLKGTDLYACDPNRNRVMRVDLNTLTTTRFSGRSDGIGGMIDGSSAYATLWSPRAIATRSNNVDMVVADTGSNRLRSLTSAGTIGTLLGRWNTARMSRGVGLDAHDLHLGPITALALEPTNGTVAPNLYVMSSDEDDAAGGQAVYQISGLNDPAFGATTYSLQSVPTQVRTGLLFENLLSVIGSTIPRVIDTPTGIGVNPKRPGEVVFSIAGTYHSVLLWDGVSQEITYASGNLPSIGYSRFAGTGAAGYNGEGPASLVQVNSPRRIRFDKEGNCYFLALNANGQSILRRVSSSDNNPERWRISTIAGGGSQTVPTVSGSAPPVSAVQANIGSPTDFDVDSQGNLYIASSTRIYRLDQRAATMTEVYNSGNRNFSSIAFDENDAAIMFAYAEEPSKIKKVYLSRLF